MFWIVKLWEVVAYLDSRSAVLSFLAVYYLLLVGYRRRSSVKSSFSSSRVVGIGIGPPSIKMIGWGKTSFSIFLLGEMTSRCVGFYFLSGFD